MLFTVDTNKCNGDGICAAACPVGIIKINDQDQTPVPVKNAESNCINCGHCATVCPTAALSLKSMPLEDCLPVQKELLPDLKQVEHLLLSRRSIRKYKKQPLERDAIIQLINTARYGPTASNKQPVQWLVIENSDEVHRFTELVADWMRIMLKEGPEETAPRFQQLVDAWERGEDGICRGAPHVIVTHSHKSFTFAKTDCAIALNSLELTAFSMGLGTCWAGYFNTAANMHPPLKKALGIPEEHMICGALLIGYPTYQYHRIPKRNKPVITWR